MRWLIVGAAALLILMLWACLVAGSRADDAAEAAYRAIIEKDRKIAEELDRILRGE